MRIVVAAAVMAFGIGSQAMAAEPSSPFGTTVLTMHDAVSSAPTVEARLGMDKGRRFEAHLVTVADQFATDGTALRHRFASSMIEFYPLAQSGFHMSGGLRFFNVTNFSREADKLTNNLLWSPAQRGFGGIRTGFKRYTPAMTFGYTRAVAQKATFGLEAGALLGRVNASMPSAIARSIGGNGDDHRMNPVANMVFGLKF